LGRANRAGDVIRWVRRVGGRVRDGLSEITRVRAIIVVTPDVLSIRGQKPRRGRRVREGRGQHRGGRTAVCPHFSAERPQRHRFAIRQLRQLDTSWKSATWAVRKVLGEPARPGEPTWPSRTPVTTEVRKKTPRRFSRQTGSGSPTEMLAPFETRSSVRRRVRKDVLSGPPCVPSRPAAEGPRSPAVRPARAPKVRRWTASTGVCRAGGVAPEPMNSTEPTVVSIWSRSISIGRSVHSSKPPQ